MKVLIIIPAYNEELNIVKTVKDVTENTQYDYVIVNDGSKDKTKEICESNNFNLISLPINYGLTSAIQVGMKYALKNNYDVAIQFDGDGQHDINCIDKIIEPLVNGQVDMCIGTRYLDKSSSKFQSTFIRRLGSSIISLCIKICTGAKITDPTSGFRAVNKKVIEEFAKNYPTEYPEPESTVSLLVNKYKVKEVPVNMNEREGGNSSLTLNLWKPVDYMIKVILAIIVDSISFRRKGGKK